MREIRIQHFSEHPKCVSLEIQSSKEFELLPVVVVVATNDGISLQDFRTVNKEGRGFLDHHYSFKNKVKLTQKRSLQDYFVQLAADEHQSLESSVEGGRNISGYYYYIQIAAIHVDNSEFPLSKLLFKLTLQLAMEEAEKRLEGRKVKLLLDFRSANTCSRQYAGAIAAEEYYIKRARFFIVSGCDDAIRGVSRLTSQWGVPVMTAAGFGADLNDKQVHRGLIRVAFSLRTAVEFLIKILKSFNWHRVNLIVDESDPNSFKLKESIKQHVLEYDSQNSPSNQTTSASEEFSLHLNTITLDLQSLATTNLNSASYHSNVTNETTTQLGAGQSDREVSDDLNDTQVETDRWPNMLTEGVVRDSLKQSSLFSRVNILLIPQHHLRKFMLSVYDQQMANGMYTFINMPLLLITSSQDQLDNSVASKSKNFSKSSYTSSTADNVYIWRSMTSSRNQHSKQAFESLMSIYLRTPTSKAYVYFASKLLNLANTDYATTQASVSSFSTKNSKESSSNQTPASKTQLNVNPYSASFYDCIQIYSIALNESLAQIQKEFSTFRDSKNSTFPKFNNTMTDVGGNRLLGLSLHSRIIEAVKRRRFENMVTGTIFINENGDRVTDYTLDDLNPMTGKYQPVRLFRGETKEIDRLGRIHWSSDESIGPTIDSVDCQLIGTCASRPFSKFFVTFILLALPLVVLMVGLLYFVYNRINLESQLVDYWWKINFRDIELINARRKNGSSSIVAGSAGGSHVSSSHVGNQSSVSIMHNRKQKGNQLNEDTSEPGYGVAKSTVTKVTMDTSAFNSSAADVCYGNISLGIYKLSKVAIKPISKFHQSRKLMIELRTLKNITHNNLCRFVGIVVDEPNLALVSEFCPKGSLREFFQNESMVIDWTFKYSIINDVIAGLLYLHSSPIEFHGRLRSSNCLVSSRFVVKLTDYGLNSLREKLDETEAEEDELSLLKKQLYIAPEHLNRKTSTNGFNCSKKGDVYSFGLLLYEIITNNLPFHDGENKDFVMPLKSLLSELKSCQLPSERIGPNMQPVEEQINAIKSAREQSSNVDNLSGLNTLISASPSTAGSNISALVDLMKQCWLKDPNKRPTSLVVGAALKRITRGVTSKKLLENLTGRMEQYTNNLESLIDAKLATLVEEKQKAEELLYQFVPKSIALLLKEDQTVEPEAFESVTVFYSDIVGFTSLSSESSPIEVIDFLSSLYLCFDETLEQYDIFKVDTIGDAYIVASGLPLRNDGKHVTEIARAALELRERLASFKIPHKPGRSLQMRVGIHSGPCIAGIVGGSNMPKYCVFGDTLSIGKFMESSGQPMKIHITEESKKLLEEVDGPEYKIEARMPRIIKDGIPIQTYWLEFKHK